MISFHTHHKRIYSVRDIAFLSAIICGIVIISRIDVTVAYFVDVEQGGGVFEAGELQFNIEDSKQSISASDVSNEWQEQTDGILTQSVTITNNENGIPFQYALSAKNLSGPACDDIENFKAELDTTIFHSGPFNIVYTPIVPSQSFGTWNYTILLGPLAIPGETCSFDFVYDGWQTNIHEYGVGGYTHSKTIHTIFTVPEKIVSEPSE